MRGESGRPSLHALSALKSCFAFSDSTGAVREQAPAHHLLVSLYCELTTRYCLPASNRYPQSLASVKSSNSSPEFPSIHSLTRNRTRRGNIPLIEARRNSS